MNSRNDVARHDDGEYVISTSKFHFVDLAGSERVSFLNLSYCFYPNPHHFYYARPLVETHGCRR